MFGKFKKTVKDPRVVVASVQTSFLASGLFIGFDITFFKIMLAVITCLSLDYILAKKYYGVSAFPFGALPTAYGLGLYFRSSEIFYVLAGAIAILSKYYIRNPINNKQIFNPSNFAIIVCLFSFPSLATAEFTQWGDNFYFYAFVTVAALAASYYARVIELTISFLASYAVLVILLTSYMPDIFSIHHYGLIGPSIIVFSSLMITDPKSCPAGVRNRIYHGFVAAALFFILEYYAVMYSIFLALFFATTLNAISVVINKYTENNVTKKLRKIFGDNFFTVFLVTAMFAFVFLQITKTTEQKIKFSDFSLDYILRGVEAKRITKDPSNPIFNVAKEAGIEECGGVSTGASWGDINNDGFEDLYVSNYAGCPNIMYLNNKDGTFTNITEQINVPKFYSNSSFLADYDNDRKLDLFIMFPDLKPKNLNRDNFHSRKEPKTVLKVYRNLGNLKFADVTKELGLERIDVHHARAASMSFADYNNDGLLDFTLTTNGYLPLIVPLFEVKSFARTMSDPRYDLAQKFICGKENVEKYLLAHSGANGLTQITEKYDALDERSCIYTTETPLVFDGYDTSFDFFQTPTQPFITSAGFATVFKNTGNKFVPFSLNLDETSIHSQKVSKTGIMNETNYPYFSSRFFQPLSYDYNSDGKMDIFITSDIGRNLLLENKGDFKFEEVGIEKGLNILGTGMGVDIGDVNNKGKTDIYITNSLKDFLFSYNESTQKFVLSPQVLATNSFGWGVSFLDYNLDEKEDLIVTSGGNIFIPNLGNKPIFKPLFRENLLFKNIGEGKFEDDTRVNLPANPFSADNFSSKSLAMADYDNNGSPDVFVGYIFQQPAPKDSINLLYKNVFNDNNYLVVELAGKQSNSYGVGSEITVTTASSTQTKVVTLGNSYQSQNSLRKIFGLGKNTTANIEIKWPTGKVTSYKNIKANQHLKISE